MAPPRIVQDEPRYQQQTYPVWWGEASMPVETWHLDGIPWYKAAAPARRGHEHFVQTVGWLRLFDLVSRCACGAISMRPDDVWFYARGDEGRFTEEVEPVRRRWFRSAARR